MHLMPIEQEFQSSREDYRFSSQRGEAWEHSLNSLFWGKVLLGTIPVLGALAQLHLLSQSPTSRQ